MISIKPIHCPIEREYGDDETLLLLSYDHFKHALLRIVGVMTCNK